MDKDNIEPSAWHNMSLMDKATLVAQLSAPIALLATVIFSWLSWAETRRASEIQMEMFAAENAPTLQFARLDKSHEPTGLEVVVHATNTGASTAFSVCLEAYLGLSDAGLMLANTCAKNALRSVDAGGTRFVGSVPVTAVEGDFERFVDYGLIGYGDTIYEDRSVFVRVVYKDVVENHYSVSSTFQGVPG